MSTVSSRVNHGITFGNAGYVSPLTITSTGAVNNEGSGKAIFGGNETVVNDGKITATGNNGGYGYQGIYLGSGYVNNVGTITSGTGNAVLFQGAGSLVNSGFIYGGRWGVSSLGLTSITNTGTISGGSQGIVLSGGGFINNSNLISGADGIGIGGGLGTVVNSGTVASYGAAVALNAGGTVSNTGSGLISTSGDYGAVYVTSGAGFVTNAGTLSGYFGVQFSGNYNNTLIDTGTIFGSSGTAVQFGSGNDLLRFDPSASIVIQGVVDGGGGTNTLEFTSGASSGTLTGQGADFVNFGHGSVAAGAQWTIDGNVTLGTGIDLTVSGTLGVAGAGTLVNFGTISSPSYGIKIGGGTVVDSGVIAGAKAIAFGGGDNLLVLEQGFTITGSIAGFTGIHDAIDLKTLSDKNNDATTSFNTLTNVLTVTGDNGSVQLQLDSETYTGAFWTVKNDGSNGTEVTPLCFCAGSAIATPGGEERVERLKVGDLVLTASGKVRPITWIGAGRVLATRGRRNAATPVIVRKDALAPNVPHQDLHLTKAHSLYLDGVLIPVEFLVNHRTIVWDDRAREVEIYHVELESHDVLIANGALAESYRDDGNRWLFQNAQTGTGLSPQEAYAPVLTGGPVVDAVWERLLDRAGPRDTLPLTDDPDLHLIVDGARVDAQERRDDVYVFRLRPGPKSVIVASRVGVPSELGIARDPRALGVALRRVAIRQGAKFMLVNADDKRLMAGFHDYEPSGRLRWTDGRAALPIAVFARFDKGAEVMLQLGGAMHYRAEDCTARMVA
jgi:hypothetical protein